MGIEEKELLKYAKWAAWERFKKEVMILKGYKFSEKQLHRHISLVYNGHVME